MVNQLIHLANLLLKLAGNVNDSLRQYIETSILPSTGLVEENEHAIVTYEYMVDWIKKSLRIEVPQIIPQVLANYLLMYNEGIIQKRRNFYLNTADFYDLELPLLGGNGSENEHKEIMSVLIMPDAFCKSNEFYYCTCDEWMILTSV